MPLLTSSYFFILPHFTSFSLILPPTALFYLLLPPPTFSFYLLLPPPISSCLLFSSFYLLLLPKITSFNLLLTHLSPTTSFYLIMPPPTSSFYLLVHHFISHCLSFPPPSSSHYLLLPSTSSLFLPLPRFVSSCLILPPPASFPTSRIYKNGVSIHFVFYTCIEALLHQLLRCLVKAMQILEVQIHCLGFIYSSLGMVKFFIQGVDLHGLMLTITKIKIKYPL